MPRHTPNWLKNQTVLFESNRCNVHLENSTLDEDRVCACLPDVVGRQQRRNLSIISQTLTHIHVLLLLASLPFTSTDDVARRWWRWWWRYCGCCRVPSLFSSSESYILLLPMVSAYATMNYRTQSTKWHAPIKHAHMHTQPYTAENRPKFKSNVNRLLFSTHSELFNRRKRETCTPNIITEKKKKKIREKKLWLCCERCCGCYFWTTEKVISELFVHTH